MWHILSIHKLICDYRLSFCESIATIQGKQVKNAFMESFNTRLWEECLNVVWFKRIEHARQVTEVWRIDYNENRPHSTLGFLTPKKFTQK